MNLHAVDAILGRADDLGVLADVVAVLREAEELERAGLSPWAVTALQSAYVLARTTDKGTPIEVRDLLTTAATALALDWRTEIYTRADVESHGHTAPTP